MIIELYDGKNAVIRKSVNLSKQTHIIIQILRVTTTKFYRSFSYFASKFGVDVILLFNKTDLFRER